MKPTVYIETTVISYLVARASRDVVIAGHQQVTRAWWERYRSRFQLVTSERVYREAEAGDAEAAQERISILSALPMLKTDPDALQLAENLLKDGALPGKASEDALHIAVATVNGIDYLLTWNMKHIANALMRTRIEAVCRSAGYQPVTICTPEELMEDET